MWCALTSIILKISSSYPKYLSTSLSKFKALPYCSNPIGNYLLAFTIAMSIAKPMHTNKVN